MHESRPEPPMAAGNATALDAIVERFESAWRRGRPPDVADYLRDADGSWQRALLLELAQVDLEYRIKSGRAACAADYLGRFSTLARHDAHGPLISWELELRARLAGGRVIGSRPMAPPPDIPGYEILGTLGRGAMGIVYKARQVRLNRLCALKMILAPALASPEMVLRFLIEAEIVARLRHPNIVQIHHFGDHPDGPFIELEFVGDRSLAGRLDETRWHPREAAALVEQVARAIDEAHRQGIVHRDLKPSNILLTADGTPKVADFGLAKMLKVDSGLTETQVVLGTPQYMAPEQAEGHNHGIGRAADIYSLGAILYEMLIGRPPFHGSSPLSVLQKVKYDDPVPPSRLRPRLPRDLETICLKCLRKEPSERYGTAAELADDLRRFRDGKPIRARRASAVGRAIRWARCQRTWSAWGAVSAVFLIVLLALMLRDADCGRMTHSSPDRADTDGRGLATSRGLKGLLPGEVREETRAGRPGLRSGPATANRHTTRRFSMRRCPLGAAGRREPERFRPKRRPGQPPGEPCPSSPLAH
jgi:tRNA A-37 threonylcarbamoyl transferase component Bud32